MGKGLTINCSLVEQDGDYNLGFNYNDTDGININREIEGDNLQSMIEELSYDIVEDMLLQSQPEEDFDEEVEELDEPYYQDDYVADLEKYIAELEHKVNKFERENNSLKTDLEILQRRADDDAVNNNKSDERSESLFPHYASPTDIEKLNNLVKTFFQFR